MEFTQFLKESLNLSLSNRLDFAGVKCYTERAVDTLASGQPFQLALQSLLLVLGCGQLALRNILFVSQLFQFFAHGQLLLSDNGQNKSDQLFTVDRLWGYWYLALHVSVYPVFQTILTTRNNLNA